MGRGGFRPGAGRKKGTKKEVKTDVKSLPLLAKAEEFAVFYAGLMEKARSGKKMTEDDRQQMNALAMEMARIHSGGEVAPVTEADETRDAKEYLEKLLMMNGLDKKTKIQVANILLPFQHQRIGEGKGKKEEKDERAKRAGAGRFAPGKPPIALVK